MAQIRSSTASARNFSARTECAGTTPHPPDHAGLGPVLGHHPGISVLFETGGQGGPRSAERIQQETHDLSRRSARDWRGTRRIPSHRLRGRLEPISATSASRSRPWPVFCGNTPSAASSCFARPTGIPLVDVEEYPASRDLEAQIEWRSLQPLIEPARGDGALRHQSRSARIRQPVLRGEERAEILRRRARRRADHRFADRSVPVGPSTTVGPDFLADQRRRLVCLSDSARR